MRTLLADETPDNIQIHEGGNQDGGLALMPVRGTSGRITPRTAGTDENR
jgi:hypothetical protein